MRGALPSREPGSTQAVFCPISGIEMRYSIGKSPRTMDYLVTTFCDINEQHSTSRESRVEFGRVTP
eukprot:4996813-Amphidinium_carterae.1